MKNPNDNDAFIERIAEPLRAPERAYQDFDLHVMSSLRGTLEAAPRRSGSWLRRPRTYRVTPLAQLAMAAGIAMLMAVAAWSASRWGRDERAQSVAARPALDTVHVVRFVFVDSSATHVALVGSFGTLEVAACNASAAQLLRASPGDLVSIEAG